MTSHRPFCVESHHRIIIMLLVVFLLFECLFAIVFFVRFGFGCCLFFFFLFERPIISLLFCRSTNCSVIVNCYVLMNKVVFKPIKQHRGICYFRKLWPSLPPTQQTERPFS